MSDLVLLTTLRYSPSNPDPFPLLKYHTSRLQDAWSHFAGLAKRKPEQDLEQRIGHHVYMTCDKLDKTGEWRVRVLLYFPSTDIEVESYPMPPGSPKFQFDLKSFVSAKVQNGKPIVLDPETSCIRATSSPTADAESEDFGCDPADLYRYKTTKRHGYESVALRGKSISSDMPIFDTVLHWLRPTDQEGSTEDLITELTTSNIAIQSPSPDHHAQWITPRYHSESAPFLRGVMRTYLLSRGELREEDVTVERFKQLVAEGRRVVGINGLRGIWLANPIML